MLLDWENETDDLRKLLLDHARAIADRRPLKSYVMSAEEMSAVVLKLFGQ